MKNLKLRISLISAFLLTQLLFSATNVRADYLSTRTFSLTSNLPSAVTAYTMSFVTTTTANIGSIRFLYCTTRFGACTVPVGLDTMSSSVTLEEQFGMGAFTFQQPSQGELVLVRSAAPELAGTFSRYKFTGITNPSFSNVSFFVRMSTYSSDDGTGPSVDDGGAVASINSSLSVEGITPETLSFCIGASGNSCSNLNGQLVDFGDFSPSRTSTASTVMFAATNAPGGYTINMYGNTLASGSNVIPPMGDQSLNSSGSDVAVPGTSQFGANVVGNTVPAVGAPISGNGIGSPTAGYGSANHFRFFSGDTLVSSPQPSDINKFTNSYVVNVSKTQPLGFYTGTIRYVCTGNF